MSRVGKKAIVLPSNVQVAVSNGIMSAKGPKGELHVSVPAEIGLKVEDGVVSFTRSSDHKTVRALHGLTRALAANAVNGVVDGFHKQLQIEGVGFRAELRGTKLLLTLGYSHPILFIPPPGIAFEVPAPTQVVVRGIDRELVGEVAARVRRFRKPEPYKGKGVRYAGEFIRRKAGKSAGK